MAAPRATQFIALRNLARNGAHQVRTLHMTGPATYAPRIVSQETANAEQSDNTTTRAFSTAIEQSRRAIEQPTKPTVRHFNTSRILKAPKDTSTIDFAFLPADFDPDSVAPVLLRVPILPTNFFPPKTGAHAPEVEAAVMRPEISSMSADAVFLPMSDHSDGHAMDIDFHEMADRFAATLRRATVPVEEQAGFMKQIWNDMVDDILAVKRKGSSA